MTTRSVTAADLPALAELRRRYDIRWLDVSETDEDELREEFGRLADPGRDSRIVLDGTRVLGAALRWRVDTALVIDPDVDPADVYEPLIEWLADTGAEVEAVGADERLRATLLGRGWRLDHTVHDLARPVSDDWQLPEPTWSDGVELRGFRPDHATAVHRLVYVDARFADVRGHVERDLAEWRSMFLGASTDGAGASDVRHPPVVAWRARRPVGVSIGQLHGNGTGWIHQLAVAQDERGHGLGRALVLETYRRQRAAGATRLGLGVVTTNVGALRLYLDLGLRRSIDWEYYRHPASD